MATPVPTARRVTPGNAREPPVPGTGDPAYAGNGSAYPGASHDATGWGNSQYGASAYGSAGYGEQGGAAAGQGATSGYGDAGYGAGRSGGAAYGNSAYGNSAYGGSASASQGQPGAGFQDTGYGQRGYDAAGYNGASGYGPGSAYGTTGANGQATGAYQAGGGIGSAGRANGEFRDSPAATAQYGGLPSPQETALGFPDFTALDAAAPEDENSTGTPRPYGRLSIFTLLDDKVAEFDRLAERAAEGVRTTEPDTLVYVIHVVPKAPMQRIIYEIYRDRAAMESHERQPHIQRFVDDRKASVLATNVIDLRLKYAKVAALGTPAAPQESQYSQGTQTTQAPRALESGTGAYASPDAGGFGGRRDWPADPARDQYAATGTGRYPDSSRYAELGAGRQSEAGRYAGGSGQFPEQSRDDQPSYQGQRYGGR